MYVVKRNGTQEPVQFDKITTRTNKLCYGLNMDFIDPAAIAVKVIQGLYSGITTSELDQLTAETCAYSSTHHPDWSILGARIAVSNLHKNTESVFSRNIQRMFEYTHPITGEAAPLIHSDVYEVIMKNADKLDNAIYYDRDYEYDYFGFKTLEKAYLLKMHDKPSERPQQMLMRVSCGIHTTYRDGNDEPILDLDAAIETYNLMSQRFFTHATPTLYNSGTPRPQLSSCFLLTMEDSVDGIFKTLKDCATISKYSGGIGINIHDIRANKSYIKGTNGVSSGIVPMLRVFNDAARYINQSGRRNGSMTFYLEPWHNDILDFLDLKKNNGKEEMRARDLFYAMWISDLFMERVEANSDWTLFCPNETPGLSSVYGEEFKSLYTKYEQEGKGRKTMKAQALWFAILQSQIETGTPYILYKDAANMKSNQKNLGTIKGSNLCVAPETLILTFKGEVQIKDLKDQEVNVWNGDEFSKVTVRKTGEMQKLITVTLSNGIFINCTPYHKFIVRSSFNHNTPIKDRIRTDASELKPGDEVVYTNGIVEKSVSVVSVKDNGRVDDTYCFTEPNNNAGIFNGILTGNCAEILEYTAPDEIAVCNLASLALNAYVKPNKTFDYAKLLKVTGIVTRNLNKVIDINYYPVPEAKNSNLKHRPIGIGVQGLADTFAMMGCPFESEEAARLNRNIFETIYYGAVSASCDLAEVKGPYETFRGDFTKPNPKPSPAAEGLLQFDLWGVTPNDNPEVGPVYNWKDLKERIERFGLHNSLLLAPMPTASTAQILGNNESIEPFTSLIYTRRVLAGEFPIVNKHLMNTLVQMGLWNERMRMRILANKGSIQNIQEIPQHLRDIYKTVWEIKQRTLIDLSADRGAFICQTQSLNLFIAEPTISKLTSMHFHSWRKGLKTGMYYLRTRPKADPISFTVDQEVAKTNDKVNVSRAEQAALERNRIREAIAKGEYEIDNEVCTSCSS
jgi:ribonucleotide reductase alpha subunit